MRYESACLGVGANCVMTSEKCLAGTDRIAGFSGKGSAKVYTNL